RCVASTWPPNVASRPPPTWCAWRTSPRGPTSSTAPPLGVDARRSPACRPAPPCASGSRRSPRPDRDSAGFIPPEPAPGGHEARPSLGYASARSRSCTRAGSGGASALGDVIELEDLDDEVVARPVAHRQRRLRGRGGA